MRIRELSADEVLQKLKADSYSGRQTYHAMYSSWFDGVTKDPRLMMVPIDDHMVHRGDAVFEAIKCLNGRIYALDAHLERMLTSAGKIGLQSRWSLQDLRAMSVETARIGGANDFMLRLFLSRGPGSFTTNPYETLGSQLYVIMTSFKPLAAVKYENGVSLGLSGVQVKEGLFATVKSCNYLPNVMMKKEAIDRGLDYTVSRDENGFIAEGSTENFAIVSKSGELLVPGFERTLKGVTASRAMELAEHQLVPMGLIRGVRHERITVSDVIQAREAMMLGTSLDCLPVVSFEAQAIADGKVGAVCRELLRVMREDMAQGPLVTRL